MLTWPSSNRGLFFHALDIKPTASTSVEGGAITKDRQHISPPEEPFETIPFVRDKDVCVGVLVPNRIKKFRRLQRFTTFLALLPSKSRHTILQTNRDLDIAMQEGELGEPDMGLSRICSRQEWVPIQDPDSKARMLAVMATVYQNLGLDSRAESLLKQAIPPGCRRLPGRRIRRS